MKKIFILLTVFLTLLSFNFALAEEDSEVEINFFYSETCPHCTAESNFLDEMEEKYSDIKINRYILVKNVELAKDFFEKNNIGEDKFGAVPVTFVNDKFFLGFDNSEGIGSEIEKAIKDELEGIESIKATSTKKINLPIIGKVNPEKYSLPILTIIIGLVDGLNVCSLGALMLILGLVLTLRSRTKIIFYGGIFIITTALSYGFLVFLWYKVFGLLSSWMTIMQLLIGLIATGGGIYFLKEFIRFKRKGAPTCDTSGKGFTNKFSKKVKKAIIEDSTTTLATIGIILLFAVVVTIIEFPCSAAVPLVFTGILNEANLSGFSYLFYIVLFMLFYLLDELLIFGIAIWKMSIWMSSPKFVTWSALIGAMVMFGIGGYYLLGLI